MGAIGSVEFAIGSFEGRVMNVVRLNGNSETSIELWGLAADQWRGATKLQPNARVTAYMCDVKEWALKNPVRNQTLGVFCVDSHGFYEVCMSSQGSATLFYIAMPNSRIVFWMSGLFRPLRYVKNKAIHA